MYTWMRSVSNDGCPALVHTEVGKKQRGTANCAESMVRVIDRRIGRDSVKDRRTGVQFWPSCFASWVHLICCVILVYIPVVLYRRPFFFCLGRFTVRRWSGPE